MSNRKGGIYNILHFLLLLMRLKTIAVTYVALSIELVYWVLRRISKIIAHSWFQIIRNPCYFHCDFLPKRETFPMRTASWDIVEKRNIDNRLFKQWSLNECVSIQNSRTRLRVLLCYDSYIGKAWPSELNTHLSKSINCLVSSNNKYRYFKVSANQKLSVISCCRVWWILRTLPMLV